MLTKADSHLTMHWIKEVEIAKPVDVILTSRSIVGRRDFPDYDLLDAMIASASKRLQSKCRRAACSEIRPIVARKADCLHDL